jgi:hypothetical protein
MGRQTKTPPPLPERSPSVFDVTPALMRAWRLAHSYTLPEPAQHAGLASRQLSSTSAGRRGGAIVATPRSLGPSWPKKSPRFTNLGQLGLADCAFANESASMGPG